jgi:hypothetical protein
MNDNVVKLDEPPSHQATYVACLACGKDWVAVAPAETLSSMSNCSKCKRKLHHSIEEGLSIYGTL